MRRPILASLVVVASSLCAAQPSVAQTGVAQTGTPLDRQPRPEGEPRFSDSYELRTITEPLPESRRDLDQPLEPSVRELSRDIETDLNAPVLTSPAPPEPSTDSAATALDLFAGPRVPQRQNLPQSTRRENPAQPENRGPVDRRPLRPGEEASSAREQDPDAATEAVDLFRPVGPVRSPTRDASLGRRGAAGLDELRRILPRGADDPFAPLGLRMGTFVLYPTLEQSVGVSDNLTNTIDGVRGAFSETTLAARLLSNWSRHEAEINALASYRRNSDGPLEEEPRIDIDGRLRIDIDRDWTGTLRGAFRFDRDDAIDSGLSTAAGERDILAYSAAASLARSAGRLQTDLEASVVREDPEDAPFDALNLRADESFTTWSAGLRAGYDISPPLRPFLSGSVGRRLFDDELPGVPSRDSVIPALRGGLGFDWGEKLSGEVALGYAWNLPDEDAYETTDSPTLDATINWSPRRGTDVVLRAETYFEPDTGSVSTSTLYQGSVGLRHRATARIDLEGRLVAALREGPVAGDEYLYASEAGLTYWLNRTLAFTARYRYDRFNSPLPGLDYDANTVRVGLRLQR